MISCRCAATAHFQARIGLDSYSSISVFQCGIPGSADAVYLEEHGLLTTLKSGEPSFTYCRIFCFNLAIFQNNPERAW